MRWQHLVNRQDARFPELESAFTHRLREGPEGDGSLFQLIHAWALSF